MMEINYLSSTDKQIRKNRMTRNGSDLLISGEAMCFGTVTRVIISHFSSSNLVGQYFINDNPSQ